MASPLGLQFECRVYHTRWHWLSGQGGEVVEGVYAGIFDVFDLAKHPFGADVTNPIVRGEFEAQAVANQAPLPSPGEAARAIYKRSWSPEHEQALSQPSAADFEALFRKLRGDDLTSVAQDALEFRKIVNATQSRKR
jgi:hypothetical protein